MAKKTTTTTTRTDVMQEITDRFIKILEEGLDQVEGWVCPWNRVGVDVARNALTGKAYLGMNQMLFGLIAEDNNQPAIWGTYKQYDKLGLVVAKGQRATMGVKWVKGRLTKAEEAAKARGEKVREPGLFPNAFFVFNIGQVVVRKPTADRPGPRVTYRGVIRKTVVSDAKTRVLDRFVRKLPDTPQERSAAAQHAEKILLSVGINVTRKGDRAFYSPGSDSITLPPSKQFPSQIREVGVLAHEHVHATGHKSRLDRETVAKYSVDDTMRAAEELVAELGCAALLRFLDVEPNVDPNHDSYLKSWISILRNDKWALNRASKNADQAVGWLLKAAGLERDENVEPAPEHVPYETEEAKELAAV